MKGGSTKTGKEKLNEREEKVPKKRIALRRHTEDGRIDRMTWKCPCSSMTASTALDGKSGFLVKNALTRGPVAENKLSLFQDPPETAARG